MTKSGNPYHDRQGKFTTGGGSGKTPTKQANQPSTHTQHRSHAAPTHIQAQQLSTEERHALIEKNVRAQWAQGWRPKGRPMTLDQYLAKAKNEQT